MIWLRAASIYVTSSLLLHSFWNAKAVSLPNALFREIPVVVSWGTSAGDYDDFSANASRYGTINFGLEPAM